MSSFTIPRIESSAAFESVSNHGDIYIYSGATNGLKKIRIGKFEATGINSAGTILMSNWSQVSYKSGTYSTPYEIDVSNYSNIQIAVQVFGTVGASYNIKLSNIEFIY